MKFLVL